MSRPEPFARLVRDHERIAEVVATARAAAEAALQYEDDPSLVPTMIEELRALQSFMETELALHIAREEQVIFPAFRALTQESALIDGMLVQHDRVRERHALLDRVLAAIDGHHDEAHHQVQSEQDRLRAGLQQSPADVSRTVVAELADAVRQLDWILQGHFSDEEDDLFTPGEVLFTSTALLELATAVDQLT